MVTIPISIKADQEYDFWISVLRVLSGISNRPLTKKELELMAFSLCRPDTVNKPFHGPSRDVVSEKMKIGDKTYSMHYTNLTKKGWIVDGNFNRIIEHIRNTKDNVEFKIAVNLDGDR